MDTLFGAIETRPRGFTYTDNFLTLDEELQLLDAIQSIAFEDFVFHGYTAKRRVKGFKFGQHPDYQGIFSSKEIPEFLFGLREKVAEHTGIASANYASALITDYPPGSVINWHRDAPPYGVIAGVSLGSPCVFMLRPHDKTLQSRQQIKKFEVAARSLYVMKDEARWDWQHSTRPVAERRYSITYRTLSR